MGYKLPSDIGSVTDLKWFLIAIPDDPAFETAALGAYTDLANVWKWGLEGVEDDSYIARQLWLKAIGETIGLIEMGFPETLLGYIDEIEDLLKALQTLGVCCPDNVTYGPAPSIGNPDGYDYHFGPFPDTWGDGESVADLDDYQEILCGAYGYYVDYLVGIGPNLDAMVDATILTISAIVAVLSWLASGGLALLVEVATAWAVFDYISLNWTTDLFQDASDDIESVRDDLICALATGDASNVESVIQGAVSSTAWNAIYKWIDYQSAINAIYTGEYDGATIPVQRDDSCECTPAGTASGLYFWVSAGVCKDAYNGDIDIHGTEMYYYRYYKIYGDHASVNNFQLNITESGGTPRVNADWHFIETAKDTSGCPDDPVLIFYDEDLSLVDTAANAEVPGWAEDEAGVARFNHQCSKYSLAPNHGYAIFYITPAA